MTKRLLIFNPYARGEKSRRFRQLLAAVDTSGLALAETSQPGQASQLAAEAAAKGCSMVIVAGGDGTINEVVNGLGTTGVPLGIIPVGTVNVFARELGIPLQPRRAWEIVQRGHTCALDLGVAEFDGRTRYFVQLAGVGLDARAVFQTSWKLKKRIGPLSYVYAGLKILLRTNDPVRVELPNAQGPITGKLILVGNGRYYGGPYAVFPQAKLDDGKLDVCVFSGDRWVDIIRYSQGVLRGCHLNFPDVHYFQVESFTCHPTAAARPMLQLDGENAGRTPVRFRVATRSLHVVAPRH